MTGIIFKTKLIFGTEFIFVKSNAYGISQNTLERKEEEF